MARRGQAKPKKVNPDPKTVLPIATIKVCAKASWTNCELTATAIPAATRLAKMMVDRVMSCLVFMVSPLISIYILTGM